MTTLANLLTARTGPRNAEHQEAWSDEMSHTILQVLADGPYPDAMYQSFPRFKKGEQASEIASYVWGRELTHWLEQLTDDQFDRLSGEVVSLQ